MSLPILIVEDSADDALLLKRQLSAAGLCNPCHSVTSAKEALAYIGGRGVYADRNQYPKPKVVLLDLKMPEMDGFQLLERLQGMADRENVLVVAVSALDDLQSIRRAYQLGANSFLSKPCEKAHLESLIQGFPAYWSRTPCREA